MNNLEDNLKKIKVKKISEEDKSLLWQRIATGQHAIKAGIKQSPYYFFLSYGTSRLVLGAVALCIVFGTASATAISSYAHPGDTLFPLKLAVDRAQVGLASGEKKDYLRLQFAEERVMEVKAVVLQKAEDKNRTEKVIASLEAMETTLNSTQPTPTVPPEEKDDTGVTTKFSERENKDIAIALTKVEAVLTKNEDGESKEQLENSMREVMNYLEKDGAVEIRRENGRIKLKNKSEDEVPIEIFCLGEWRKPKDCDGIKEKMGEASDDNDEENTNKDTERSGEIKQNILEEKMD